MVVYCWICYNFAGRTLKGVLRHMRSVHSHESNFHLVCGINSCPRTYTKFPSFKKHLYRHHRCQLDSSRVTILTPTTDLKETESEVQMEQLLFDNEEGHDNEENHDFVTDPELEKKTFGLFLLKMKEVHKVSQNALITMVDDVNDLIQDKIKTLEIDVMSTLASFGVGSVCCNELKKLFSTAQCTPFSSLNTTYLQEKYYREYLGLLVRIIVSHNILYAYFL